MATSCLSAALEEAESLSRYVSLNVSIPQFSMAPAAKSGTATRSVNNKTLVLKRVLIACRKTETKLITLTNQKGRRP